MIRNRFKGWAEGPGGRRSGDTRLIYYICLAPPLLADFVDNVLDAAAAFTGSGHEAAKAGACVADDLGVQRNRNPWGIVTYQADELGKTNVPGVYVIGEGVGWDAWFVPQESCIPFNGPILKLYFYEAPILGPELAHTSFVDWHAVAVQRLLGQNAQR
jgi:hypothetical protein